MNIENRYEHPGWAVRFQDGTWLCSTMCLDRISDCFYATTYDSMQDAEAMQQHFYASYADQPSSQIVEAWQPICEVLRLRITNLKQACAITPQTLDDTVDLLKEALHNLQHP